MPSTRLQNKLAVLRRLGALLTERAGHLHGPIRGLAHLERNIVGILSTDHPSSVYFLVLRWERRPVFRDYAGSGNSLDTIVNYQWAVHCVSGGACSLRDAEGEVGAVRVFAIVDRNGRGVAVAGDLDLQLLNAPSLREAFQHNYINDIPL